MSVLIVVIPLLLIGSKDTSFVIGAEQEIQTIRRFKMGNKAKRKIERVSSMIEGVPCTVIIDGRTKNYTVRCTNDGVKYIQIGPLFLTEAKLPFGEEVML